MYDLGRHGTTSFLTMEYVSGEDLKRMIGMSGQLGVGTAISIAKQVCDGLAEAHRLGVVHRDRDEPSDGELPVPDVSAHVVVMGL
jgi:serine/threonine-protein kinase